MIIKPYMPEEVMRRSNKKVALLILIFYVMSIFSGDVKWIMLNITTIFSVFLVFSRHKSIPRIELEDNCIIYKVGSKKMMIKYEELQRIQVTPMYYTREDHRYALEFLGNSKFSIEDIQIFTRKDIEFVIDKIYGCNLEVEGYERSVSMLDEISFSYLGKGVSNLDLDNLDSFDVNTFLGEDEK